jgi:hypothetical protein
MKLLLAAVLFTFSVSSFSQTRIVSVDAFDMAYSGGLSFKHDEGKNDDRDTTTFKFNLNFAQNWEQYVGLMWKAKVYWNRVDVDFGGSDTLASEFGVAGGFLYNFNADNIKNSIMAGFLVGAERATYELAGGDDKSGFNLFLNLEAGKRWDLGSYASANISYAPTIGLNLKRYGGDIRDTYFKSSRDIRFNFLKFDILF